MRRQAVGSLLDMPKPALVAWTLVVLLAVPAAALTLVRLTDPGAAVLVQLQAYTPFALLPYALVLVVLLVVLVRGLARRVVALPVLALVVAGTALHASWLVPSYAGGGREPDLAGSGADGVVVLSTNLYFGRGDGAAVVQESAERGVDVLVGSEVTPRTLAAMEGAGLDELMPHRAGRTGDSFEGTMVFSREPITDVRPISGTTFDNLLVTTAGIELLAAHPAAPLEPDDWREDHAVLREVVEAQQPDVVVGDLNATLDHAPVRALVEAGYRDSAELLDAGLVATWPANGLYPVVGLFPPSAPIDHLLLAPSWTATATGTVEIPDTDHLAITTTVVPAA